MAPAFRSLLSRLSAVVLVTVGVASCSSVSKGPGGQVSKVKTTHLIPNERYTASDPSLNFERQYLMHGAVTAAEQMERGGNYYAILWKANDRSQPVTVRFEYRQANTGLEVRTIDQVVEDVRRNNWSKFQVTGTPYWTDGRVSAWKVTLLQNGEVIASQQSYLWE